MSAESRIPLYLFARAPVAGTVKTRMQPALSPDGSARLAEIMLLQTVSRVSKVWPGVTVVAVTPSEQHQVFQRMIREFGIKIAVQQGNDLGQRMANVLLAGIKDHGCAVVMGCDVPHFGNRILESCYAALSQGKNVVGPTLDGGFYLLGLQRYDDALFSGVRWGGAQVMAKLGRNAGSIGMELHQLDKLRDVDNFEDLVWLAGQDERYRDLLD